MRALALGALVLGCLSAAGCGGMTTSNGLEVSQDITMAPPAAPGFTCYLIPAFASPVVGNPWPAGTKGYVIYNPANWPIPTDGSAPPYGVVGVDTSMNKVWSATVNTFEEVEALTHLPQTMQFSCPYVSVVGQVSTGGQTQTGGNGGGAGEVCFQTSDLQYWQTSCQCVPEPTTSTCAGKSCGGALDNCANVVSCGTCGLYHTCSANVCQCARSCAAGTYLDEASCTCKTGLPQ